MDTNYMVKWQGYCYNLRTKDWNYMKNRGINSNWLYPVILNAWYIIFFQAAAELFLILTKNEAILYSNYIHQKNHFFAVEEAFTGSSFFLLSIPSFKDSSLCLCKR